MPSRKSIATGKWKAGSLSGGSDGPMAIPRREGKELTPLRCYMKNPLPISLMANPQLRSVIGRCFERIRQLESALSKAGIDVPRE